MMMRKFIVSADNFKNGSKQLIFSGRQVRNTIKQLHNNNRQVQYSGK
jgi:hypothetical protein